ncbi:MAG TPA: PqqD family peptide modification chaperone [Pirellulales bacterium]|nr:PqqD family peptide modification chaperone [Pirellulales bacterium]
MSTDLYSPSWYRVEEMRPRLRSHVRIHRHHYRGERWYVLEDRISKRVHRFNPVAHYVIGLMDGRRTVNEIWESAISRFGDDAPTQDEVIRLLSQLHSAEVLQTEITPDLAELMLRARKSGSKTLKQNLLSPLAIRIPMFDPDRGLTRWLAWYQPLFGLLGALIWLAVVAGAAVSGASHWDELTQDVASRVLAPENLLMMLVIFPVLKLFHEFGHACAVKAWGGEVHEMGIMFLVLMPIPYVDASSASTFRSMRQRVVVGAAGMIAEVFIAALALFLWIDSEPGVVRAVLYNIMLIAGISTVLFNGNPLLRYDGYYILSDLIHIPNLRVRSNQYLGYLVERYMFGVKLADFDATASEKRWFLFFGIASFLYRMFVMAVIALFVAAEYFIVGVILAAWVVITAIILPLAKGLAYLLTHQKLRRYRVRALAVTVMVGWLGWLGLFVLPTPHWTRADGVIWIPDDAQLRAGADGFVRQITARSGQVVSRGTPLIYSEDPQLQLRIRVLEAQLRLLGTRAQAELQSDLVTWALTNEEIKVTTGELEHARGQADELTIFSPASGEFVPAIPNDDMRDRFVRKGQLVGYVIPTATVTARVLVSQDNVDLVRSQSEKVRVKLASRLYETYDAHVRREVPAASDRLSNPALSTVGGGPAAADPRNPDQPKTLENWFEFELVLPGVVTPVMGEHVYVRFEHASEPLAYRAYRSLRQLFMKRFTV